MYTMPPAAPSPPKTPSPKRNSPLKQSIGAYNQKTPADWEAQGKINAFMANEGVGKKIPNMPENPDYMRGWSAVFKTGGSRKRRNTRRNRTVRRR
jgi:hypothetical protein